MSFLKLSESMNTLERETQLIDSQKKIAGNERPTHTRTPATKEMQSATHTHLSRVSTKP